MVIDLCVTVVDLAAKGWIVIDLFAAACGGG